MKKNFKVTIEIGRGTGYNDWAGNAEIDFIKFDEEKNEYVIYDVKNDITVSGPKTPEILIQALAPIIDRIIQDEDKED